MRWLALIAAFILATVAFALKGLMNLLFVDVIIVFALPVTLLYKLLGDRPKFFATAAIAAAFAGFASLIWIIDLVPSFLLALWGWIRGEPLGGTAALLIVARVFAHIFFAAAGFCLVGACLPRDEPKMTKDDAAGA